MQDMKPEEAALFVQDKQIPPDDLVINHRPWKLEGTYLTKPEAKGSAELIGKYKIFKYPGGFALYERDIIREEDVKAGKELLVEIDWPNLPPLERRLKLQEEKVDPSSMKATDACGLIEWIREQISDENMAGFDYRDHATVFRDRKLPVFASALDSMSRDESRHKLILETILEVITEKFQCK